MSRLAAAEDRLFTDRRLWFYGSGLLAGYAIALLWVLLQHSWLFDADGRPHCIDDRTACIDFPWMWLAGSVGPARVYDYFHLAYPPTYLLLIYPLSWMPFGTAFVVWMLVTLLLYLAAICLIIPRPVALVALLAPFPVVFNIMLGHDGFLVAGLLGLSLVSMERRPWLPGIFLGLLTFKPQFGNLFPFALLAARNWRTAVSAAVTGAIFAAIATILCGYRGWLSFAASLTNRGPSLSPDAMPLRLESL